MSSITSIQSNACPYIAPNQVSPVVEHTAWKGLVPEGSCFENILRDVFSQIALCEEDALKLRALSIEKEQEWRQELLRTLGKEGVAEAQKNRTSRFVHALFHVLEPIPMIGMGVATIVSGGSAGAVALAVAGVAIGGFMAIDALFGDALKTKLADSVAREGSQDAQAIVGGMYVAMAAISIACSFGLSSADAVMYATKVLSGVSETTLNGVNIFTTRRANVQAALVKELESALRLSDSKMHEEVADIHQLEKTVSELFKMLEATMRAHQDAASTICAPNKYS